MWPDDPPIPVPKPASPLALAAPEQLRLEFLTLSLPAASATGDGQATVVLERAPGAAAEVAAAALPDPPLPVPKPAAIVAAASSAAAASPQTEVADLSGGDAPTTLRIEPLLPHVLGNLASLEANRGERSPLDATPFAPAPVTSSLAVSVASNALRFQLPRAGNLSIVPSLALLGLPPADPNLVRMAEPHDARLTPAPGLDAIMQLGDMTLDAKLNQPLRAVETKDSPDTRSLPDRSNFGVDMKFKF